MKAGNMNISSRILNRCRLTYCSDEGRAVLQGDVRFGHISRKSAGRQGSAERKHKQKKSRRKSCVHKQFPKVIQRNTKANRRFAVCVSLRLGNANFNSRKPRNSKRLSPRLGAIAWEFAVANSGLTLLE